MVAFEAGEPGYELDQVFYGYFKAGAYVYRFRGIVLFSGQYYGFGAVFYIRPSLKVWS